MNRALAFTSRAAIDIEDAYNWYEGRRAGLGADFQRELARIIQLLEAMPESGPVVHRDLRRRKDPAGDLGAIVHQHGSDAFEAEFVRASGKTQAVISLAAADSSC